MDILTASFTVGLTVFKEINFGKIIQLNIIFTITPGDQVLQTGGESLDDSTAMDDEDISPQPAGRRNRREACTCPFCKDGEGRYVRNHIKLTCVSHTRCITVFGKVTVSDPNVNFRGMKQ